jgi:hypothetical protein
MFSVCTGGRRFSTLNWSKGPGRRRYFLDYVLSFQIIKYLYVNIITERRLVYHFTGNVLELIVKAKTVKLE